VVRDITESKYDLEGLEALSCGESGKVTYCVAELTLFNHNHATVLLRRNDKSVADKQQGNHYVITRVGARWRLTSLHLIEAAIGVGLRPKM